MQLGSLIGMCSVQCTFSALNRLVVISSFYLRYILYAYAKLSDDYVIDLDKFIPRVSFGVSKNENTHQMLNCSSLFAHRAILIATS